MPLRPDWQVFPPHNVLPPPRPYVHWVHMSRTVLFRLLRYDGPVSARVLRNRVLALMEHRVLRSSFPPCLADSFFSFGPPWFGFFLFSLGPRRREGEMGPGAKPLFFRIQSPSDKPFLYSSCGLLPSFPKLYLHDCSVGPQQPSFPVTNMYKKWDIWTFLCVYVDKNIFSLFPPRGFFFFFCLAHPPSASASTRGFLTLRSRQISEIRK